MNLIPRRFKTLLWQLIPGLYQVIFIGNMEFYDDNQFLIPHSNDKWGGRATRGYIIFKRCYDIQRYKIPMSN